MKLMVRFLIGIVSVVPLALFAYSSSDVDRANLLAEKGIIVDRSDKPSKYRLDSSMLRQELLGTALKSANIYLPADYACRGYYLDATFSRDHQDAWVCRTFEIAADHGFVTRSNTTTRPKSLITRAEALAIIVSALNVTQNHTMYTDNFLSWNGYADWQTRLLMSIVNCRIINQGSVCQNQVDRDQVVRSFRPNDFITRAEAFEFLTYALGGNAESDNTTANTTTNDFAHDITCDEAMAMLLVSTTVDETLTALDAINSVCLEG